LFEEKGFRFVGLLVKQNAKNCICIHELTVRTVTCIMMEMCRPMYNIKKYEMILLPVVVDK